MLIIFGGLPATGKTTLARELARQIGATYVRIDSIEQAMRDTGAVPQPVNDVGYRVGYAVAEENLRLGRTVVADSVNPLTLTREAWREVARRARVGAFEIEVKCSDLNEHRRRVETRASDMAGLRLPTWEEVISREYQPWDHEHFILDTSARTIEKSVSMIREMLRNR